MAAQGAAFENVDNEHTMLCLAIVQMTNASLVGLHWETLMTRRSYNGQRVQIRANLTHHTCVNALNFTSFTKIPSNRK